LDNQTAAILEREALLAGEVERLIERRIADTEAALGEQIAAGTAATGNRIAGTNNRVARIDEFSRRLRRSSLSSRSTVERLIRRSFVLISGVMPKRLRRHRASGFALMRGVSRSPQMKRKKAQSFIRTVLTSSS
ncbi:MAG: hypothetical protein LBD48_03190, partial [Treponema sp.]|nr:hypothetical protein [Treponema sp.]